MERVCKSALSLYHCQYFRCSHTLINAPYLRLSRLSKILYIISFCTFALVKSYLYTILSGGCYLLGQLPRWVLKVKARPLAYLLYHGFRYRRALVAENLRNAFPERSDEERKEIEHRYYLHLADTLLWSFKIPYLSRKKIKEHLSFANVELLDELREQGHKTIILTMGHIGNWEVFTGAPCLIQEKGYSNANIYKQLSNPYFDRLMIDLRQKHGASCIEMRQTAKVLLEREQSEQQDVAIVAFLADQCPFPEAARYGTLLFDRATTFIVGWETIARKMNLPVVYMNIESDSRFHWTGHLQLLSAHPSQEKPYALVERYARLLEENIRRQPHAWLWSHNRWRIQPKDVARITLSPSLENHPSKDETD